MKIIDLIIYYELLQVLGAELTLLDEIDSGLDVDILQDVAKVVEVLLTSKNSVLMITHYHRLLEFIRPNYVHIMVSIFLSDLWILQSKVHI